MTATQTGIIKALVYADLFDFPLTEHEIFSGLVSHTPTDLASVTESLNLLEKQRLIDHAGIYYFLPGKNQLVRYRKNRLKPSVDKHMQATKMARHLSEIPGVMGVAVTGTVAVENAQASDDIDLMIVTAPKKMWTTRLLVTGYLELLGARRRPGEDEAVNAFCVNLYVDNSALTVPTELQNLYTAHEVVQAKFLYQTGDLASRFIKENRWVRRYLPNTPITHKHLKTVALAGREGAVERICFHLQKLYMARRITRELVTQSSAYFHPKDMAKVVLSSYDRALKQYEIE